jgi:hypothetical protein
MQTMKKMSCGGLPPGDGLPPRAQRMSPQRRRWSRISLRGDGEIESGANHRGYFHLILVFLVSGFWFLIFLV